MDSIKQYNALHGKSVNRTKLQKLIALAKSENQKDVYKRLNGLLSNNPDIEVFNITIKNQIKTNDPKSIQILKEKRLELSKKSNDLRVKRTKAKKGTKAYNELQSKINALDKKRDDIAELLGEKRAFTTKDGKRLAAPRHEGIAKEALTDCGRLKSGYKYLKGGKIEKIDNSKDNKKSRRELIKSAKYNIGDEVYYLNNANRKQIGKINFIAEIDTYKNQEVMYNVSGENIPTGSVRESKLFLLKKESSKKKDKSLAAPRHEGIAKEALTDCGRLKPGYKYLKGGKIVKVEDKRDLLKPFREIVKKSKSFDEAFDKTLKLKNVSKEVSQYFYEKYNPNSNLTPRESFLKFYSEVNKSDSSKKSLLEQKIHVEKLTDTQIKQIIKEYASDILWKDDIVKYMAEIAEERKKRQSKNGKKLYSFIYEVSHAGGYRIKSFIDLPTSRSVKFIETSDNIKGLKYYKATENGLKELQKKFPDNAYGDKQKLSSKDLYVKVDLKGFSKEKKTIAKNNPDYRSLIDLRNYNTVAKTKKAISLINERLNSEAAKVVSAKLQWENDLEKLQQHLKNQQKKQPKIKSLGTVFIDVNKPTATPQVVSEGLVTQQPLANVPIYNAPEETTQQKADEQPAPTQKPNTNTPKGVISTTDLMSMKFDTIQLTGPFSDFMQDPAKNMRVGIFGRPKNGKTAGSTALANELTKHGTVLYNFVDQGLNKSTQKLWELSGLSQKPNNAFLTDTRDLDQLEKLCASGKYDYVFIDMINNYIHLTGIKYHEFESRFLKKYPDISFILVFESTKSGDFKGDQGWTHIIDQLVNVEDFVMHSSGRYGVGDYVVWKEGLAKVNPKKFEEYFTEEVQTPTQVMI